MRAFVPAERSLLWLITKRRGKGRGGEEEENRYTAAEAACSAAGERKREREPGSSASFEPAGKLRLVSGA